MNERMTLRSVAGYSYESALWRLLVDVCNGVQQTEMKKWKPLTPDSVVIEDSCFRIDIDSSGITEEFFPPEGVSNLDEAAIVWSIGAVVCYASSGHYIFGGRGGEYQKGHPKVSLPVLRKEHSALTPLVQRCLCYNPVHRISLNELRVDAEKGMALSEKVNRKEMLKIVDESGKNNVVSDDIWPEKMD